MMLNLNRTFEILVAHLRDEQLAIKIVARVFDLSYEEVENEIGVVKNKHIND